MEYFRLTELGKKLFGWEKPVSGRRAHWMKLPLDFFDSKAVIDLPDSQRLALIGVGMLCLRRDNRVEYCVSTVRRLCRSRVNPDLNLFIAEGLIELDATVPDTPRKVTPPRGEEKRGEEKRNVLPADAGPRSRRGGWPAEAAAEWNARFGGEIAIGKVSGALKPLVDAHGWPEVKPSWIRYLDDPRQEQMRKSPANFVERFAFWRPPPARVAPPDAIGLWHSRAPELARTFQAWLKVNQQDGEIQGLAFYRWLEQSGIPESDRESAAMAVSIELKRSRKANEQTGVA